ncbi:hypothetical protein D7V79_02445 [Escherichia coli]|nr:hypothetical protein [Escherichia coli]
MITGVWKYRGESNYTFVKPGETTPTPVTNAIIPLQVSASIANDLGGSEKIELDGKAVISVVYL